MGLSLRPLNQSTLDSAHKISSSYSVSSIRIYLSHLLCFLSLFVHVEVAESLTWCTACTDIADEQVRDGTNTGDVSQKRVAIYRYRTVHLTLASTTITLNYISY